MEAIIGALLKKLMERQMSGQAQQDGQNAQNEMSKRMQEAQGESDPTLNQAALNQTFPQQTNAAAQQPTQEKSTLESYQDYLRGQNKYSDDVINGVAKGLNNGYKEIADWQNQYANSAEGKQNGFTIPKGEAEIALAKSNAPKYDGGIEEKATLPQQNKSWVDNLANALGDIRSGYEENRDNAFKADNMYTSNNNGFMKHIGEGAGTLARMASNPTLQGVVAGLATGAMTGNPLAGLMSGYNTAHKKSNSNMYQDLLKKDGINVNKGGFAGDVDLKDYTAMSSVKTQREANERALKQLEEALRHNQVMEDYYMKKADSDELYKKAMIDINNGKLGVAKQNANTKEYAAHNKGSGSKGGKGSSKGGSKAPKPQEHKDWNADLAGYSARKSNPKYASSRGQLKAMFIQKYGVDPDKYLK